MALPAHPVLARHGYGGFYCMVAATVCGLDYQYLHGLRRYVLKAKMTSLRGVADRLDI